MGDKTYRVSVLIQEVDEDLKLVDGGKGAVMCTHCAAQLLQPFLVARAGGGR